MYPIIREILRQDIEPAVADYERLQNLLFLVAEKLSSCNQEGMLNLLSDSWEKRHEYPFSWTQFKSASIKLGLDYLGYKQGKAEILVLYALLANCRQIIARSFVQEDEDVLGVPRHGMSSIYTPLGEAITKNCLKKFNELPIYKVDYEADMLPLMKVPYVCYDIKIDGVTVSSIIAEKGLDGSYDQLEIKHCSATQRIYNLFNIKIQDEYQHYLDACSPDLIIDSIAKLIYYFIIAMPLIRGSAATTEKLLMVLLLHKKIPLIYDNELPQDFLAFFSTDLNSFVEAFKAHLAPSNNTHFFIEIPENHQLFNEEQEQYNPKYKWSHPLIYRLILKLSLKIHAVDVFIIKDALVRGNMSYQEGMAYLTKLNEYFNLLRAKNPNWSRILALLNEGIDLESCQLGFNILHAVAQSGDSSILDVILQRMPENLALRLVKRKRGFERWEDIFECAVPEVMPQLLSLYPLHRRFKALHNGFLIRKLHEKSNLKEFETVMSLLPPADRRTFYTAGPNRYYDPFDRAMSDQEVFDVTAKWCPSDYFAARLRGKTRSKALYTYSMGETVLSQLIELTPKSDLLACSLSEFHNEYERYIFWTKPNLTLKAFFTLFIALDPAERMQVLLTQTITNDYFEKRDCLVLEHFLRLSHNDKRALRQLLKSLSKDDRRALVKMEHLQGILQNNPQLHEMLLNIENEGSVIKRCKSINLSASLASMGIFGHFVHDDKAAESDSSFPGIRSRLNAV